MAPGPSSRGCEACRAQKKKCDLAQPACSRCRRLRLPCTGCGQQRFKFTEVNAGRFIQKKLNTASPRPTSTPSNETTRLRQALVTRLQGYDDVRYCIRFRFGAFLAALPGRLGRNKALDASIVALLNWHTECCMRQDQAYPQAAAISHNRALAALRNNLDDPREHSTTDTVCAVWLLASCQERFDDQFTHFWSPHGRGIAQLIRMRQFTSGGDPFEKGLFGVLHATLLFHSFANPDIHLHSDEYRKLETALGRINAPSRVIPVWQLKVRISELMSQGREAITSGSSLHPIATAAQQVETSMQVSLASVYDMLKAHEAQAGEPTFDVRLHASNQRNYGVALATHAVLLCAQRTLSPQHPTLHIASAQLCHDVLQLVQQAKAYRPVSTSWTVHLLNCTWCATDDPALRGKIESALLEYQRDAMGSKAALRLGQLRQLEKRLSLQE